MIIKMNIELLIIIILSLMLITWKVWFKYSTKKLERGYTKENDKARNTGTIIQAGRDRSIKQAVGGDAGLTEFAECSDLQTTNTNPIREDSPSPRTITRNANGRIRGIFRRKGR